MELKFRVDTKHRKDWFTGISFSHPAKMSLPLQLWIIDNYTKEGEVILDPMAGSGTIMVACSMGRNVICVELEEKFCKMMAGNWGKIKQRGPQLGYSMGWAKIIQGDARNLQGLMADAIISSPPYEGCESRDRSKESWWNEEREKKHSGGSVKIAKGYQADAIISSPPYAETLQGSGADAARKRISEGRYKGVRPDVWLSKGNIAGSTFGDGYSRDPQNLSNLPYGNIDAVITSPPYEDNREPANRHFQYKGIHNKEGRQTRCKVRDQEDYVVTNNIGNLKSASYLQAMLQVYSECYRVLKSSGLMVLVTKDFIRDRKRIDLAGDTIKLCEQAGFHFVERHYRKLSAMSFWRVIYYQKNPEVEKIDTEDILVFKKSWS